MKQLQKQMIVLFVLLGVTNSLSLQASVHIAHLSSSWYSQDPHVLKNDIAQYVATAKKLFSVAANPLKVRALLAPHAGYRYSGVCAASAFQSLLMHGKKNTKIKKVIVLAPLHAVTVNGIVLPGYDAYKTVLGEIPVDRKGIDTLQAYDLFNVVPGIQGKEHSLEVQLPFLQQTIEQFSIIPLLVGQLQSSDFAVVAKILAKLVDEKTLIVVSSDFTHFGKSFGYVPFAKNQYFSVRQLDSQAIEAIAGISIDSFSMLLQKTKATICGRNAIKILLSLIQQGALGSINVRMPGYYMSSQGQNRFIAVPDVQMGHSVSYAGLVFSTQDFDALPPEQQLTGYETHALLQLARDSIANAFRKNKIAKHLLYPVLSSGMHKIAGAFVTLQTKKGALRGCIGRIVTTLPLYETVSDMAISAAFHDSRFSPLKENELKDIVIDITILTLPKKVTSYKDIKLGRHGIILEKNGRQAVFLPQVPGKFGWDLDTTLQHLSVKAGLSKDAWKKGCAFKIFEGFTIK